MEDKDLCQLITSEQTVCGAYHAELGATVKLVALLLLCIGQGAYELLGEHRALLQIVILLGYLAGYGLGCALSVTSCCKTFLVNAVVYEVADHAFGALL